MRENTFVSLHRKLSSTAKALKRWSSSFYSDLSLRATITSELIFMLDKAMDNRPLSQEEQRFRASLKMNSLVIAAMQRSMWRQRSRISWLNEEVKSALADIDSDKAPDPDGFTVLFFKKAWEIILPDLMRAIKAVETCRADQLELLNDATLILLPKTPTAAHPREFRPISLVSFFAKLVTKILASRLSPRMNELINPCQSAFIKRRSIHDNFVYVQSLAKLFRQTKTLALLLKLYVEKAFDSISWEFLLEILQARGFSLHWRNLIATLLASSSTRILVNGHLTELILHRRGLRQGDPLSPLLFYIMMDVLAKLVITADTIGALHQIGRHHMPHCISLYADDVVLFVSPSEDEITTDKLLLKAFGNAMGLQVNFSKSSVTPISCNQIDTASLATSFGCLEAQFPCRYLGMPLSDKKLRRNDLQPAIDKLYGKVKGWLGKGVDKADRPEFLEMDSSFPLRQQTDERNIQRPEILISANEYSLNSVQDVSLNNRPAEPKEFPRESIWAG
ncbi:hypothetical protein ACQ4PT_013525 [Festuca glaucescens]